MWALIAFIALGIVVATLIELNERSKAKKQKLIEKSPDEPCRTACAECGLVSVCEKEEKTTAAQ